EGYDFVNRDNDPADDMGHGTAVAGIIAESTPSNVVILPIKVADNKGAVATSVLMQGIHYASQNGADIMNISIGGALNSSTAGQSLFDLYSSQLADYSQPLICASGNDGVNSDEILYFTAAAPTTISVGSIKNDGARHGKSNYGNSLDFCAPGAAVRVAYSTSGSVYGTRSGTSFAAPYISAIAADLYAAKGNLSRDGLYTELQAMSEDLGDPGKDIYYGNGCPKFEKAKLNGFVTENGKTYYYIDDIKVKGQKEIDGSWYMFDLSSGAMQTGWFNHTATTNPNGGKKRVYYNNNGQMVLGWQNISGKTYYFDPSSGAMQTGYQTIEGNWYWFNESSGVREYTGVVKNPEDNRWYFVRNGIGEKYTGTSKSITTGNYFITKDGILDWNYTGFGKAVDSGKWLFVRKGKHDPTFTGVAKSIFNNQWYHGKNGVLDWNFTGFSKSVTNGKWYFSRNGKLDWNFTGVAKSVANGK
ncbi:MAG: S8 family serine peptidase, partial [Erysipelotrichaceae bacterium]|nr:S8 family serine peptidase [Erysipelotrichaceae bacterium]